MTPERLVILPLVLLGALLAAGCPLVLNGPVPPTVYLTADDHTVRLGFHTSLHLEPRAELKAGWSFEWSAMRGTVIGAGGSATYTAPADPGFDIITVTVSGSSGAPVSRSAAVLAFKQFIILKADDYVSWSGYIEPNWAGYLNYLVHEKRLKNSVGVITACLSPDYSPPGPFVQDTIDFADTGYVEFWFHGHIHAFDTDHDPAQWTEFQGSSYEYQKASLDTGLGLARQYLQRPMTTFGAPFDLTDETTTRVLDESSDITVCFGHPTDAQKLVLSTLAAEVEKPVGMPNFELFLGYYRTFYDPNRKYTVIQVHPGEPAFPDHFDRFRQIIDFLVAERATFILPREYYALVHDHQFPLEPGVDSDGDGVADTVEGQADFDGDGIPEFLDANTHVAADSANP